MAHGRNESCIHATLGLISLIVSSFHLLGWSFSGHCLSEPRRQTVKPLSHGEVFHLTAPTSLLDHLPVMWTSHPQFSRPVDCSPAKPEWTAWDMPLENCSAEPSQTKKRMSDKQKLFPVLFWVCFVIQLENYGYQIAQWRYMLSQADVSLGGLGASWSPQPCRPGEQCINNHIISDLWSHEWALSVASTCCNLSLFLLPA